MLDLSPGLSPGYHHLPYRLTTSLLDSSRLILDAVVMTCQVSCSPSSPSPRISGPTTDLPRFPRCTDEERRAPISQRAQRDTGSSFRTHSCSSRPLRKSFSAQESKHRCHCQLRLSETKQLGINDFNSQSRFCSGKYLRWDRPKPGPHKY